MNVLAEVLADPVKKALNVSSILQSKVRDGEAGVRARHLVGIEFAKELARDHHYWCNRDELEKACIDRIAPLVATDFNAILKHWDQSFHECRQAAIDDPNVPLPEETRVIDEIFDCMENRGYSRQIAALRETESSGI